MANSAQKKVTGARFSYVQNMFNRVTKKDNAGNVVMKNGAPVTEQQCTLIFDNAGDARSILNEMMREAIVAEWGEKGLENAKNGMIRSPILAGDGKEARIKKGDKAGEIHEGLGADKFFIRVSTRQDCPVRFRSPTIPATYGAGEDQIKSGDYGFVVLHAYTWTHDQNGDGVSFGIDYLQKTKSGDPLGGSGMGGVNVGDVFETIPNEGNAAPAVSTGKGAGDLFG